MPISLEFTAFLGYQLLRGAAVVIQSHREFKVNVIPAFIGEAVLLVAAWFMTRSVFVTVYLAVIMLFVSIWFAAFVNLKNRKRKEMVEHGVRHTGRI